jgi:hypothetical protein
MNNNGTGLVMASLALADHPRVLLPIIVSNLVQHLVAGAADRMIRNGDASRAAGSSATAGATGPFRLAGSEEMLSSGRRLDPGRPPSQKPGFHR